MKLFLTIAAGAAGFVCACAVAATAEETYKAKCSTCHDAGTASAPRVGDSAEWARRNRQGTAELYKAALQGKPNTAMLAKGGFAELSNAEVTAIVDYLLAQAGQKYRANTAAKTTTSRPTAVASAEKIDDATLIARVKTALAKTKGISANDIKLEVADGVVTLRGVVDNAAQIKLAEESSARTRGVQRIDSKLIPKDLFVWD
jgi:cytochrome c5